jgi:hypothetical protein
VGWDPTLSDSCRVATVSWLTLARLAEETNKTPHVAGTYEDIPCAIRIHDHPGLCGHPNPRDAHYLTALTQLRTTTTHTPLLRAASLTAAAFSSSAASRTHTPERLGSSVCRPPHLHSTFPRELVICNN